MFKPNCQAVLFRRIMKNDGSSAWESGVPVNGFFMEHYRTKKDGSQEELSEVILENTVTPSPGDELEIKGLRRTIARVRHCTGVNGKVPLYRCSFFNI